MDEPDTTPVKFRPVKFRDKREAKRQALSQALIDGEQSGPPEYFDGEAFLREMRDTHG